MNGWEKLRILSSVIASVLVPVALAFVGHSYSNATRDKEIEARFVDMAVDILAQPPVEGDSSLRKWAIRVVNTFSKVPFDTAVAEKLIRSPLRITAMSTKRGI